MTQKKHKRDMLSALVFIVLCLFAIFYAIPNQITLQTLWGGNATGVSSRTFPYFAAWMILGVSVLQFAVSTTQYVRSVKAEGKQPRKKIRWGAEVRALLVFGCCLLYMWMFTHIGYLAATPIAATLVLLVLKDRKWTHYVSVYAVGAVMYVIFQYLLKINLP